MKLDRRIGFKNQPEPFTPGVTKEMVRERLRRMLPPDSPRALTLEQWVLAECDLVHELQKAKYRHPGGVRILPARSSHQQKAPPQFEGVRARAGYVSPSKKN